MTAGPAYDGQSPYRQMNFQYSLLVQQAPYPSLSVHAYLAQVPLSPQQDFISSLLKVLGSLCSIVVYNQAFENIRLLELKEEFLHWNPPSQPFSTGLPT